MKILSVTLVIILALLQYELWFSKNGVREYFVLKKAIVEQTAQNAKLIARNQAIATEISDLKNGQEGIEEHARNDLGMIKNGETFYQVINPSS